MFNTFFALASQDDQTRCFGNVAEHLADDGVFVIEASSRTLRALTAASGSARSPVETDSLHLEASTHDRVA